MLLRYRQNYVAVCDESVRLPDATRMPSAVTVPSILYKPADPAGDTGAGLEGHAGGRRGRKLEWTDRGDTQLERTLQAA